MPFKQDPAGRPWVEKVSRTLELIIPFKNNLATLMAWWEENWDKLDVWAESILKKLDTKMDKKNPVYEGTLNGFKTDYLTIPTNVINTDTRVQIVSKMQEKHLFTYKTDDNIFPNALPSTASKKGVLEVVKVTNTIAYFTYKEDGEVGDTIYTSAFNNGKVTEWTANKGEGYNSIPSGGSANKFLKWAASGVAQWANVTWGDITGKPANYNPPVATSTVLGGVKIGNGINIDGTGTISIIPAREGLIPIGALLLLDNVNNPALMFPGTTWSKIEERFLYGTSGATGQLGGRNSFSLTVAQMPKHNHSGWTDQQGNHNHTQDGHAHTQPDHTHGMPLCFGYNGGSPNRPAGNAPNGGSYPTYGAGGETTGVAQPDIRYSGQHGHNIGIGEAGSGEAINIMPQYYTINIWKRLS